MYLRTTKETKKDGYVVTYYQLAHNERDPVTRKPVAKIIHSFGRTDNLEREQLVRLCRSLARICKIEVFDPLDETQSPLTTTLRLPLDLKLLRTYTYRVPLLAETLWEGMGIGKFFYRSANISSKAHPPSGNMPKTYTIISLQT
jgi:hypothetical protein